jgi:translocation and assembly module TamA
VLGRLQLGKVWVEPFEDLPLSQRFFAGGDQSVRGFDYQALAPRNEDGDVIGGRYLAVASVELEQLLVGNWGAAVFTDHGNAVNDLDEDLRTSVGVGLRYRSPVGVFRLDVARATDGDESARLHLSLGVDL